MAHKFFKVIAAVLAVVLLASVLPFGLNDNNRTEAAVFENANEVTESSRYRMYVNEETLSLIIEDKQTGAFMESSPSYDDEKSNKTWWGAMNSAVVVTMISGNDDTKQADMLVDKVTKKITYTKTGFSADLYWTKYQFGMTLEVSLTDDGLTVRIPDSSIKEDGEKYKIGTITMYPYMGVSYKDDKDGYILVPDGNGALIYLTDKEGRYNSGFSYMIYGSDIGFDELKVESLLWDKYKIINDSENIIAPIFGIAHTDDKIAYLAVVEDGAMRATIDCMPNGVSVDYNRAYAKFIERKLYTQPTSNNSTAGSLHITESDRAHSDLQVRYIFLSDDAANYSGMANAYRDYLIKNEKINSADSSYKTRIDFLGTDREEWVIGTTPVVMTTVDDVRSILDDLSVRNVTDILSIYKGWQKGGINRVPVSTYKADSKIGGTSGLTKLIKDCEAKGIEMYLYDDALRINPDEFNVTFNVVKKINKRKYEEQTFKEVYSTFNYVIPSKAESNLLKFAEKMNASGVNGICLSGITSMLYSYTYNGKDYTRYDTGNAYSEAVSKLDESTELIMEQPFAYLWADTGAFLDMPLYTSNYEYEDEFVPFLSMVLKGVIPVYSDYVNFEANKQEFFLKMVESGSFPSFYITRESSANLIYTNSCDVYSSQYSAYADTISEYSAELKAFADAVSGATIAKHEIFENGITKVTYSNGVKIYVNYSKTSASADSVTLDSMTYKLVK